MMTLKPLELDVEHLWETLNQAVKNELDVHFPQIYARARDQYDAAAAAQKQQRDARRAETEAELKLRTTSVLSVNVPALSAALEQAIRADANKELIERAQVLNVMYAKCTLPMRLPNATVCSFSGHPRSRRATSCLHREAPIIPEATCVAGVCFLVHPSGLPWLILASRTRVVLNTFAFFILLISCFSVVRVLANFRQGPLASPASCTCASGELRGAAGSYCQRNQRLRTDVIDCGSS